MTCSAKKRPSTGSVRTLGGVISFCHCKEPGGWAGGSADCEGPTGKRVAEWAGPLRILAGAYLEEEDNAVYWFQIVEAFDVQRPQLFHLRERQEGMDPDRVLWLVRATSTMRSSQYSHMTKIKIYFSCINQNSWCFSYQ